MFFDLALFPLNTVLFPGMPLALHIFEERYKLMIGDCIDSHKPFGVVLIKQGVEANEPLAEPHSVGCLARITHVQRLGEGRMNVGAIGTERFRIRSLEQEAPYLVGSVESLPLGETPIEKLNRVAERLRPFVEKYMLRLSRIEGVDLDPHQIPVESLRMAYYSAGLLQIPVEEKQRLLSIDNADEMLTKIRKIYRRELAFVDHMLEIPASDDDIFSLN